MRKYNIVILSIVAIFCFLATACQQKTDNYYVSQAIKLADSQIAHNPELWQSDFTVKPKWDYTQGLIAEAMLQTYSVSKDTAYLNYVKHYADYFILPDGQIRTYKLSQYNIDRVMGGYFLFDLYKLYPKDEYLAAIELLREQILSQPRTSEGGFWHKYIYPHQMWLDGLYMGEVFYARYAIEKDEIGLFDDIANQFLTIQKHTYDSVTGLNYHGWDEAKEQIWANPETGCSPNFWSRSIGWYMMAMVDVLEMMPKHHPDYNEIKNTFSALSASLIKYQDTDTKMWWQVTNRQGDEGNYIESTASAMFCYSMAKGARIGLIDKSYRQIAKDIFSGIEINMIQSNDDGTISLNNCCAVAGLGGKNNRNGSYQYYISEPIRQDDPKGIAPLIMAAIELSK